MLIWLTKTSCGVFHNFSCCFFFLSLTHKTWWNSKCCNIANCNESLQCWIVPINLCRVIEIRAILYSLSRETVLQFHYWNTLWGFKILRLHRWNKCTSALLACSFFGSFILPHVFAFLSASIIDSVCYAWFRLLKNFNGKFSDKIRQSLSKFFNVKLVTWWIFCPLIIVN